MEENQASRTALMTAYMRAYHAMHETPKIFDDFVAYRLFTEEERTFIEQQGAKALQLYDPELAALCPDQATALAWSMRAMAASVLARSRYVEDILEMAVKQGVHQYVILGAGMDTFAFRRPDMLARIQVFELDHPTTQAFKRRRLAELGWKHPSQLHFVPVDFTQENLAAALTRSSYDNQTISFFSWIGVTYYLPRNTVFSMFHTIADVAPANSSVIFDYFDTDAFVPERATKRMQIKIDDTRQLGEPLITGFDPSTLAVDLAGLGLRLHKNLNPSDIEERYFQGRTDGYHAYKHTHYAWAVVE